MSELSDYLRMDEVIDGDHPDLAQLALQLSIPGDDLATARACFEWVRDEIQHCLDFEREEITCKASDVLEIGTGYCYAKSHLLAALLRANDIPAGFCYQRLSVDDAGTTFCIHGLNAVYLPKHGWYRIDARGNRADVNAQFCPPTEQLAFHPTLDGEYDLPEILPIPRSDVLQALQDATSVSEMNRSLPDVAGR